ncbi:MAG: LolA family protein [Planctomycetota bacterium]
MNHKPQTQPVLTWATPLLAVIAFGTLLTLAAAAGFADEKTAQADPAAVSTQVPPDATKEDAAADVPTENLPHADEILTQVRSKLEGVDSLKCDLSQIAIVSEMRMQAFGRYVEATGNRVRLQFVMAPMVTVKADDLKQLAMNAENPPLEATDDRGQLLQVSNGSVMYTLWKNGKDVRLTRRSINDILSAASATTVYSPTNAVMDLGLGGLRGLIARLQTTMEFAIVQKEEAGGRSFYKLTGRWNDKVRKEVFQIPEGTIVDPRPHVPEYCRIYVDLETMLPRRIQFLKRNVPTNPKLTRPMLTLDLRNIVLNEAVDEQEFAFTPPEGVKEEDVTQQVIEMIQGVGKPAAAPAKSEADASKAAADATPAEKK